MTIRILPSHCVTIISADLIEPGVRELIAQSHDGLLWRCLVKPYDGRMQHDCWTEIKYPEKFESKS